MALFRLFSVFENGIETVQEINVIAEIIKNSSDKMAQLYTNLLFVITSVHFPKFLLFTKEFRNILRHCLSFLVLPGICETTS